MVFYLLKFLKFTEANPKDEPMPVIEKYSNIAIRDGNNADVPFLYEMLFEAFHWNSSVERPSLKEFFENPQFNRLLSDWGREGDTAVIAELNNEPVGAAWYRFWNDNDHSYGYIDPSIPEIGMAVRIGHRSKGIGRSLVRVLKDTARSNHISKVSLSVDPKNFALELYTSEGFSKCGGSGTSWTMASELGM